MEVIKLNKSFFKFWQKKSDILNYYLKLLVDQCINLKVINLLILIQNEKYLFIVCMTNKNYKLMMLSVTMWHSNNQTFLYNSI